LRIAHASSKVIKILKNLIKTMIFYHNRKNKILLCFFWNKLLINLSKTINTIINPFLKLNIQSFFWDKSNRLSLTIPYQIYYITCVNFLGDDKTIMLCQFLYPKIFAFILEIWYEYMNFYNANFIQYIMSDFIRD